MDITFREPGPWGAGKGANLDPVEVDNNFWSIAEAIIALQNDPSLPVGISSISVSGTQMTITLTDGTVMGPFTLPVLTFRWRGEWGTTASYAVLDVFTVADAGIFMVQIAHTGDGSAFDPALQIGGEPVFLQLFGSTDARLSALSDVALTDLADLDFLRWVDADAKWENIHLGGMAYQEEYNVAITGGSITGMPAPVDPSDVVNKAYVDALPAGMTIADAMMMANISGVTGPALPHTISEWLDYTLFTTARGTLIYRGSTGWVALPPGTAGNFLRTAGAGADPTWAVGGSGVTSIAAGSGISTGGAAITATGTVSLAAIADDTLLANISGSSAAPSPTTLTLLLDSVLGSARGTVLTRGVGGWAALAPGISGQYLKSQGTGADALWDSPVGSGTVTSISAGTGISTGGSPITGTGTVALAAIADGSLLVNTSGSTAAPTATSPSLFFDDAFGTVQGSLLYRNASTWVTLAPGTAGQVLTTGGAAANPSWAAGGGGGSGITQLTGEVTAGPGSGSQAAALAATAVSAGSYTHAAITVDAKGRLTAASTGSLPVNFIFTAEQALTNTEELSRFIPPACSFPSGAAGSSGTAGTAATGSTTLTMAKNGSSFATFVWAAAGTAATVTLSSTTTFNGTSDVLTLTGPATADATLAKLGINLAGTRT